MRPVYREPLFQIPAYACDISISYSISDDAVFLYIKGNQISDNQKAVMNIYMYIHKID